MMGTDCSGVHHGLHDQLDLGLGVLLFVLHICFIVHCYLLKITIDITPVYSHAIAGTL